MLLFELFASLGLDTTTFRQQADEAVGEGKEVAQSVTESFRHVQTQADTADQKLTDLEEKSAATSAVVDGLVEATGQIIEKGVEMLLEFGADSIETAASTGSELANAFNGASERWGITLDALKLKTGETLLPIATGFYNLLSSLSGVTDADRLLFTLDQIQQYEFGNIEQLNASLDGVFGRFESAEAVEAAGSAADMTAALQSQAEYWTDYANTLESLRGRNIDPQFLADIADGSKESLETLKALETADATQLNELMAAFEAVEETKAAASQSLHEVQLAVDEDLLAMTQSVEEMVVSMNQEDAAYANAQLTGQGVADGLASTVPSISSWVNYINSELGRIGEGYQAPSAFQAAISTGFASNEIGIPYWSPKASGMNYVPFDGYRAELHRGETVLTRQAADEYRAGRFGGTDISAVIAKLDDVVTAIASLQFTVNGKVLGQMASSAASQSIASETRSERKYGV